MLTKSIARLESLKTLSCSISPATRSEIAILPLHLSPEAGFSCLFNGQPGNHSWHLPAQSEISDAFLVPECLEELGPALETTRIYIAANVAVVGGCE
jgi:hypothetical protein